METSPVQHVSDTALWVAHYRAEESRRPDALFHDPFAERLAGERGEVIARSMSSTARYTAWTLAMRTVIIDRFIQEMIAAGIDTVLNLGAGLDARPYRMRLPRELKWIEVDYAHMIEHKSRILADAEPKCQLERISLDLALREERVKLFSQISACAKKVVVITEGVIPYLTEGQVAELADDLRATPNFHAWIAEYFAPQTYRYLKDPRRRRVLKNTPFQFFPAQWFPFFAAHGWYPEKISYLAEESIRHHREIPGPWWTSLFRWFTRSKNGQVFRKLTGYVVYSPGNREN